MSVGMAVYNDNLPATEKPDPDNQRSRQGLAQLQRSVMSKALMANDGNDGNGTTREQP